MTDPVTHQYNVQAAEPGSPLLNLGREVETNPLLRNWRGSYLPRPLFVERRQIEAFAADVLDLFELITSLPGRLFDGNLARYGTALGIDARRSRLIRALGVDVPPRYGRADMYHDGTSFKLLETGIASEVGGADRAGEIPRALLCNKVFASFAAEHGLEYLPTGELVAQVLREAGEAVATGREPVVALLEGPGGLANYASHWNTFRDVMIRSGLDFKVAEVGDIRAGEGGKLHLGSTPIDVILRCFTVEEIIGDPHGEELVEPIFRAHREGQVVLFTPMESNLYGNKGALAMLSDPQWRNGFSLEEKALVDRILPWTRSLRTHSPRAEEELLGRCRQRRGELILKPNGYYGGIGVVAGWATSESDWEDALKEGVAAGSIVQERVIPRSEPVIDAQTGQEQPWQAAWGLYYTPNGYAGAYARAVPAFESPIIGVTAYKNTRTAGVFHFGD